MGSVLELPSLETRYVLQISFFLMIFGHSFFLLHLFGAIIPLICLGMAFAAYGVSFWSLALGCFVGSGAAAVPSDEDHDALPGSEQYRIGVETDTDEAGLHVQYPEIVASQFSA